MIRLCKKRNKTIINQSLTKKVFKIYSHCDNCHNESAFCKPWKFVIRYSPEWTEDFYVCNYCAKNSGRAIYIVYSKFNHNRVVEWIR